MKTERKIEMFEELLTYVVEICSRSDAPDILHGIGFTDSEILEILNEY